MTPSARGSYTAHEDPKPHPCLTARPHSLRVGVRTNVYPASGTALCSQDVTGHCGPGGCRPEASAMLLRHAAWIVYDRRSASHGVGFIGRSHKLRVCGEPATGSRAGTPVSRPLAAISSLLLLLVSQLWLRAGWGTSHAVGAYTTFGEPKPDLCSTGRPHSLRVGVKTDVYLASATKLR